MKVFKIALFCFTCLTLILNAYSQESLWEWEPGPCVPGFRLIEKRDFSRFYPSGKDDEMKARLVRVYLWYPAKNTTQTSMRFEDYVRMAAADFKPGGSEGPADLTEKFLPVQLSKGLNGEELKIIMEKRTAAVRNAAYAEGIFPLLVLGQGLYYESPLSHLVLCEFLASHGYVVVTCPLLGTHYRLVNINVEDLETEIRDLEFVLGMIQELPQIKTDSLGIIGYDLGGMAGLILSMRNPGVDAFLSLDAGILFGHFSGLPGSHPHYREENFTIPWMHMTQARFIKNFRDERGLSTLMDRKLYGDSYLVQVKTNNHGEFSSYAMFGIRSAVAGYWDQWESDPQKRYSAICRNTLAFFNAYLRQDKAALTELRKTAKEPNEEKELFTMEYKQGETAPPSMAELVHLIIDKGMSQAMPIIEEAKRAFPDTVLIEENVLNWLGYHFLYWWGREEEALEVFKLNVSLFPESANTYDSLGEAYLVRGDTDSAVRCYKKSLKLNPENTNAIQRLNQLLKKR